MIRSKYVYVFDKAPSPNTCIDRHHGTEAPPQLFHQRHRIPIRPQMLQLLLPLRSDLRPPSPLWKRRACRRMQPGRSRAARRPRRLTLSRKVLAARLLNRLTQKRVDDLTLREVKLSRRRGPLALSSSTCWCCHRRACRLGLRSPRNCSAFRIV